MRCLQYNFYFNLIMKAQELKMNTKELILKIKQKAKCFVIDENEKVKTKDITQKALPIDKDLVGAMNILKQKM